MMGHKKTPAKNITLAAAARAALARFAAAEQLNDSAAIAEALRRADLSPETRGQLTALACDLDMDVRDVLSMAIAQLHARELGEPERDWLEELDDLKRRVAALEGKQPASL